MNHNEIDEYSLEGYLLGELEEERCHEVQSSLEKDVSLQESLEEIEASNRDILAQYPAGLVVPLILERRQGEKGKKPSKQSGALSFFLKRVLIVSPALASVLLLLILFFPQARNKDAGEVNKDQAEIINIKGEGPQQIDLTRTQLLIHRKRNSHVELLRNGAPGKAGDLLQLGYISAKEPYGIILSIDGQGRVSLHFPGTKDLPASLVCHQKILLPNAIELDNAPAFERFFFITSNSPLEVAGILKAAEKLAKDIHRARKEVIPLPGDINQYSLIILKGGQK